MNLFVRANSSRTAWLIAMFCACLGSTGLLAKDKKAAVANSEADAIFSNDLLPKLEITIDETSLQALRKARWEFGPQSDRITVKVTVQEGTTTYTNVALHLKGSAGSFRPIDDHPALTLNFNKFAEGQRFHGLSKISLNNSVQDPTYTSEQTSREVFLRAGVPVPRAGHAQVTLNGRNLGLYVLVEGWDKDFLRRHFKNVKGNLYDGGFLKDIDQDLSVNSGDKPDDHTALHALVAAVREKNPAKRQELLEKTLDVDRFLTYVALEVMLWDWDGYPLHKNNWRIFHDQSTGKMVFMPHGLDQMFWKPQGPVLPGMESLVGNAVLNIPAFRQRYFERLRELNGKAFNATELAARVGAVAAKVRPVLASINAAQAAEQDQRVANYQNAILMRGKSLDRQLATPIVQVTFDAQGLAALTNWTSQADFGKPTFQRKGDQSTELVVATESGSSLGAWTTVVWLPRGQYTFSGTVRTSGLVPDPGDSRGGACLRAPNDQNSDSLQSDTPAKTLNCRFNVGEPMAEVRLRCDFRGMQGEAGFDLSSLKLKKLNK